MTGVDAHINDFRFGNLENLAAAIDEYRDVDRYRCFADAYHLCQKRTTSPTSTGL